MKPISVPLLTIVIRLNVQQISVHRPKQQLSIFEHKILTDDFITALKLYSNKEITTTFSFIRT